ncbi:MAG: RagB/SusD family nutrient uptake outer membrane protein [Gemmatimonadaceae bacterium]
MTLRRTFPALLLTAAFAGCTDLNLTNPNLPSTGTFWKTSNDAIQGINATYNGLMNNGAYGRWLAFAYDIRSDVGFSPSPWTDLANFNKFTFTSYDFEVNSSIWNDHYSAIARANQVIAYVPAIAMDAALRSRIVGEAQFIRALLYFNLEVLYENVPLITQPAVAGDRPATATPAQIWAQIEKDLTAAVAVLPASYGGSDVGRATKGAAQSLLGKVYLQERKWTEASGALAPVISAATYDLVPNYGDNFNAAGKNNIESVFEVQFGDRSLLPAGVRGLNIARMVGPCGPSYCDGRANQWYLQEFLKEPTTAGTVDPRVDFTLYYNKPGEIVYGVPFTTRYGAASTDVFFKKYGEYYLGLTDQDWDAGINYRVIRFADVLLMQAEALNELGRTAESYPLVNRVRARASLAALPANLTQDQMRTQLLHERLLEFGLEGQRWMDMKRQLLLTATNLPSVVANDPEFSFFTVGKSERLPIPQSEVDLNPNVKQNPGW